MSALERLHLWAWERWHMRKYRHAHMLDVPDWYRARVIRKRFARFQQCLHSRRRPNPKATAVLDRNPEVCLDCGIGLVGPRIHPIGPTRKS